MCDHLNLLQIIDLGAGDEAELHVQEFRQVDRERAEIVFTLFMQRGAEELKKRAKLNLFRSSFGRATEESLKESGAGTRSFLGHVSILP
jgi:hypothetical protein